MTNTSFSKYHHYLPQTYLKHFTDESEWLYVYDKTKKEVRKSRTENVFGENHLNTITYPDGTKSDWAEQAYSEIETEFGPVLDKIANSEQKATGITHWDKLMLSMFVSTQFWRLPINSDFVQKTLENNDFSYIRTQVNQNGEKVSAEAANQLYTKLIRTDLFRKIYPTMLALVNPLRSDSYEDLHYWHFYYQDPGFYLTSDNPIIYRSNPSADNLFADFILPITPSRILVSTKTAPRESPASASFTANIKQFHQADRYVAGNNKEYILKVSEYYERFKEYETSTIAEEAFSIYSPKYLAGESSG